MSSFNEESSESKLSDSDDTETADDETELVHEAEATGDEMVPSVDECGKENEVMSSDAEGKVFAVESMVNDRQEGDSSNEACNSGSEAEKKEGLDKAIIMRSEKDNVSDTNRHYDADDSCLSGTLDESAVGSGDVDLVDGEGNVESPKMENSSKAPPSVEQNEAGMEESGAVQRTEIKENDSEDNASCVVVSQQESLNNFEEFRSNNLVSETRMLTAVTEETEEELLELDGKCPADNLYANRSHSLEELNARKWSEERMHHSAEQVYVGKEAVLRKGILKKDRPLSDNYENIKMIAKDSQINRLSKQEAIDEDSPGLDKRKSKSLDALLVDDVNRKSPSLTSSQLSLSDIHGSIESMDLLESSNSQLCIAKSTESGPFGHRASLNDITFTVRDDGDEPPPMMKKRRSRFSFKRKSKSTTALDKKGVTSKDDGKITLIILPRFPDCKINYIAYEISCFYITYFLYDVEVKAEVSSPPLARSYSDFFTQYPKS